MPFLVQLLMHSSDSSVLLLLFSFRIAQASRALTGTEFGLG